MAQFQTSREAMDAGVRACQDTQEQVNSLLSSLNAQMETMLGGWGGNAANSFRGLHEQWQTDARKLTQALEEMGQALGQGSNVYQQREEEAGSMFKGIL